MPWTVATTHEFEAAPTKGSRFIAHVGPASSEPDARAFLSDVAERFPDASHHCWAWRLASPAIERAGDDGEPSGSAGRPILAQLTGRDALDVAVVVSRWFGGTKLGVGGLVRAYSGAAGEALDRATSVAWHRQAAAVVEHNHADAGPVERVLEEIGAVTISVTWGAQVQREITLPEAKLAAMWAALADATRGRIQPPSDNEAR